MLSLRCPFFGSKKKKKASCWLVGSSSSFFQHFIPKGCCVRRDSNSKQTIATNLVYKQHTFDSGVGGGNGDVVCVIEKKKKRMSREKFGVKAWEVTVRKSQAALRKRAGLFTTSSVAHADDDEDVDSINDSISNQKQSYYMEKENGEEVGLEEVERVLSNGDYYTGQCTEDNLPHGTGKYLWTDGCMYVGQWFKGKTMGKGKFCWPSGAIYVGDFKNGYMDGMGTYTSSSGETYSGYWLMNLKHGSGAKHYPNGDSYDGEWRRGLQDGHGRYQWINGNHYVGQWKNGVICGNGVLVWANGNRFDGFWEDGVPKGNGTFYWPDGSYYVGVWNEDPDQINGSYCPTQAMSETVPDWDPQQVYLVELNDCKVSPCEKLLLFPSQKAINWFGVGGDHYGQNKGGWKSSNERITRRSSGGAERNCVSDTDDMTPDGRRSMDDNLVSLDDLDLRGTYSLSRPRAIKKQQGEAISKGHKNYELMLNLQLGIRHSVGRPAPATSLDLKGSAFDPKEKIWTKFPPEGSKHTPPHPCGEFKWKDYCPLVFRTLRKLLKVDPADYMISICGNDALRELSSPGKSGSFFYLTNDDRYMIKTIKKSEVKVLLRMLPAYYNHVRSFEDTLVTKFFGLHCVKLTGPSQKKVRFVIMGNLFCHEYAIHRRFDLKGSSHGRTTEKPGSEIDENTTLKDLDLNFICRLRKTWFQQFQRQVDRDCEFLEQERIMDYSLLVGVHFKGAPHPEGRLSGAGKTPKTPKGYVDPELNSPTDPYKYANVRLGVNMPVRVEHTTRRSNYESQLIGDPTGDYNDVILSFGIIDILQDYDISKKLEHAYKSFQYDPTSISAVDPRLYSRRFRDFIYKAFAEDA